MSGLTDLERAGLEAAVTYRVRLRQYLLTGTNRDRWALEKAMPDVERTLDAIIAARAAQETTNDR